MMPLKSFMFVATPLLFVTVYGLTWLAQTLPDQLPIQTLLFLFFNTPPSIPLAI